MMKARQVLILATDAPRPPGARSLTSPLSPLTLLGGEPLVGHVLKSVEAAALDVAPLIIGGENLAALESNFGTRARYARVDSWRGTARALLDVRSLVEPLAPILFILYGNRPFLTAETLRRLADTQREREAVLALLVNAQGPSTEPLGGALVGEASWLWPTLYRISDRNSEHEYHLGEVIAIARAERKRLALVGVEPQEALRVADRADLELAEARLEAAKVAPMLPRLFSPSFQS
jgi:bifunctional UDP-N-acetylglucosamine pyrophosphorylase/glucosamine-1-phosphate N-acetyltransferase